MITGIQTYVVITLWEHRRNPIPNFEQTDIRPNLLDHPSTVYPHISDQANAELFPGPTRYRNDVVGNSMWGWIFVM